jgi:hypothetical protein
MKATTGDCRRCGKGDYAWSIAWATLVARHGLPLPEDVAHVRARGCRPPAFSQSEVAALLVATGLEPAPAAE